MNPDETYPMTEPTPTLGQILSSLTSLHAKIDTLTLQQAGDRGLIALGVASPKFREEAKTDDGWIEWKGGECPVDHRLMVECKIEGGLTGIERADDWCWDDVHVPIIAYRIWQGQA